MGFQDITKKLRLIYLLQNYDLQNYDSKREDKKRQELLPLLYSREHPLALMILKLAKALEIPSTTPKRWDRVMSIAYLRLALILSIKFYPCPFTLCVLQDFHFPL